MNERQRYYVPRVRHYRNPGMRMHSGLIGAWLGVIAIALALLAFPVTGLITAHLNNSVQVITVTSKDDQSTNGGKGHQYLIFTPQGVFKDTDNFWLWKWDSSDLYNKLQAGRTYRCNVHGTRNHLTSNYPDLMACTLVSPARRAGG